MRSRSRSVPSICRRMAAAAHGSSFASIIIHRLMPLGWVRTPPPVATLVMDIRLGKMCVDGQKNASKARQHVCSLFSEEVKKGILKGSGSFS